MASFHAIDIVVITVYFGCIVTIGIVAGRYTRSTKDFFFAGQRFAWWLIAVSCIATLVGSYSFVNYSDLGYDHGLSSTVYYTNDWFIMPLFLLGWMPILYFSRVGSIPEYFERRFDRRTRIAVMVIVLFFLIGYIGFNLQTIGVIANALVGAPVFSAAAVAGVLSLLYMHHGGQMSVLATDLFQGFLLLIAGFAVLFFGVSYLGGWQPFWEGLQGKYQAPFPAFNNPPSFHFIGTFWNDAASGTVAFFFINQGIILRFMAAKSVNDGRRAMMATVLILMPMAAIAVSGGGWVGRALVNLGMMEAPGQSKAIFVHVSALVATPGFFGLVVAAMLAAMMSTLDTYINAVSAVGVNDIVKLFRPKKDDAYYLKAARFVAIGATALGLLLVPIFEQAPTIYEAHTKFASCVNPPLAMVVIMACVWRRFTAPAAFWSLIIGTSVALLSLKYPQIITPFAHGVSPERNYTYMRAVVGILTTISVAVSVSFLTPERVGKDIRGLCMSSLREGMAIFKGGEPNQRDGRLTNPLPLLVNHPEPGSVRVSEAAMAMMNADEGDMVYVADARWWLGGLRSMHSRLGPPNGEDAVLVHVDDLKAGNLHPDRLVRVEKIL